MKFLPLVWAAIMRKPAQTVLTFLSVTVAFILFGLTIGLNATFEMDLELARGDRIFTNPRFGGQLPIALAGQIGKIPGVTSVASDVVLRGYHRQPANRIGGILMMDDRMGKVLTEWPPTPEHWAQVRNHRTGILVSRLRAQRFSLKKGDTFTVASPGSPKADGSSAWTFQVLEVVDDTKKMPEGFIIGNYDYLDQARSLAERGKVDAFFVQVSDPARTAEIAQQIDAAFASSANPTQSITEKAAYDVTNIGVDVAAVDRKIALSGLFVVLFLTANSIAAAVRTRLVEFATLKTLGFSDYRVTWLVFMEAAIPCLLGAVLGVTIAAAVPGMVQLLFPSLGLPLPTISPMVFALAMLNSAIVALASSALPALRLKRLPIAAVLSGRK
jgi:putative ABC transport system permease protein